jgi:Glycosyltransferase family 87
MGATGRTSQHAVLKIAVATMLTAVLGYILVAHSAAIRRNLSERDSIAYWTAGRLLVHHQNPYDPARVLELERQQGYGEDKPLVLRTPPWSLFVVVPLGFLNPFSAWILWTSVSLGSLLTAMRLCWRIYGDDPIPRNLFTLIGYTFAPVPACLVAGQMGLVLLLGVILFLWWESDRPVLAGAALLLPFAKPHLLALFWFALFFWAVVRKKRQIAIGFMVALTSATGLALLFDPHVFQHYREMLYQASIGYEFIPALSGVLRLLFLRREFWVQFIPMTISLVWCAWFLIRNQCNWNWRRHGPALLVVSVLTTPYAWLTDEVVLLPAILQAAAFVYQTRATMKVSSRLVLVTFALLDGLLLLILKSKIPFATGIYFWSSLVWFSWYLYGWKRFAAFERLDPIS